MPYHNVLPFSSTAIRLHCGSPANIPALALSFFFVSGQDICSGKQHYHVFFGGFVKHLVTDGLIILVFRDAQYIGPITYQFLFIYLFIMCQTILDILNLKLNIYFTLYIIML